MENIVKEIRKTTTEDLVVNVQKSLYGPDPVLRAAYKFTREVYVKVEDINTEYYQVHFTAKDINVSLGDLENRFLNELVDQQIRISLDRANRHIKELLIRA
jgi:His-Xaa-Ser system protein HxsD